MAASDDAPFQLSAEDAAGVGLDFETSLPLALQAAPEQQAPLLPEAMAMDTTQHDGADGKQPVPATGIFSDAAEPAFLSTHEPMEEEPAEAAATPLGQAAEVDAAEEAIAAAEAQPAALQVSPVPTVAAINTSASSVTPNPTPVVISLNPKATVAATRGRRGPAADKTSSPGAAGAPAKRGRKKRDPNKPAAVSSAYAFFFKETQVSVKQHNPNAKFGEVSKIVASMWEALDEQDKQVYRQRNEQDKVRFEAEMLDYNDRQEANGGPNVEVAITPKKKVTRKKAAAGNNVVLKAGPHGKLSATVVPATASRPSPIGSPTSSTPESSPLPGISVSVVPAPAPATPTAAAKATPTSPDVFGLRTPLPTPNPMDVTDNVCLRKGCENKTIRNIEWEDEYCSNACVVEHCRNVFMESVSKQEL